MIEHIEIVFRPDAENVTIDPLTITRTDELGPLATIIRGGEGVVSGDRIARFHGVRASIKPRAARITLDEILEAARGPIAEDWLAGWLPEVSTHEEPSTRFVVVRPIARVVVPEGARR